MIRLQALFFVLISAMPGIVMAQDDAPQMDVFCDRLVEHVPNADVTYQPGVDVNGNRVVSVDIGSIDRPIDEPVIIPIEVDIQDYFNFNTGAAAAAGVELEPRVGEIVVHHDGRILYNGQDVTRRVIYGCQKGDLPPIEEILQNAEQNEAVSDANTEAAEKDENGIDAEALNAQESTDEGSLIEGQYP